MQGLTRARRGMGEPRPSVRPRPLTADDLGRLEKARKLLAEAGAVVNSLAQAGA